MVVATSLARQVEDLKGRATGTDVRAVQRGKGRASLLFTPDEAARVDSESILEAAIVGLEQLTALDNQFKPFFCTLFSPQAPPRELMTPDENKAVSSSVSLFLKLVSPHASTSSAQYCIEHLIRKHHIHRFDYDEMICCLLPWHDTTLFVRAIKLVRLLGGKSAHWDWLQGACKSSTPPPRKLISAQAAKDGFLMSLISRWALNASEPSMMWCSFWAAVATEALTLQDPKEHLVRALLPTVLRGLRSWSVNVTRYPSHLRDAACLVASALGLRSRLSSKAISVMLEGAVMTCSSSGSSAADIRGHMRSGILCAVAICRGQEVGPGGADFPEALVTKLITVEGIGRKLCALSTVYDVLPLLKCVLKVVVERSVRFQPPSKLQPIPQGDVDEEHGAAEQEQINGCAKEVVPTPLYYAQWLKEFSLQNGWSNDSLPSLIPWLTLEVIKQLSTSHDKSLDNNNFSMSEKNNKSGHHHNDSLLGEVNKSMCSALLINLSQKYSEEVSAGVVAAAKSSPKVGNALSEVLKDAMRVSNYNDSVVGSDVYNRGAGLLSGDDLEHQEGYALGLSFSTSLDGGCGEALPVPLFIALDHKDVAVRARALEAVESALVTSHQSSQKNDTSLENDGRKQRKSKFVWQWGGPLSSALLRRATDESPLIASRVLGKHALRDAVLSVVSAANSAKQHGDSSVQVEVVAALRCIFSRVCEWTRALAEQRSEGGKEQKEERKGIISALKGIAILMGALVDFDSNSTYHSPLEVEEVEVDENTILQEHQDLNTGGKTCASSQPGCSSMKTVMISDLAVASLMELLPCALLCMWKDKKAAKKVGHATLSAVSKLKRPHPLLLGLSAVEGRVGNSGGRSLEEQCVATMAESPHIAEVSQIMLPLCGAGARLSLARALCEAAASIGRFNSHTVLCTSMAVKLLCYVRDEISGQEKWLHEIPTSLLSGALVQAVTLFPSPKNPLALGLSYHHHLSVELLEGNNVNIEEIERSSDYNRRINSNASCCNVVQVLFKARLRERGEGDECAIARALGKIFQKQYSMRPLPLLVSLSSHPESCSDVIKGSLAAATTFVNAMQESSSGPQKANMIGDVAVVLPAMLHTLASPHDAVRKSSISFLRCVSHVFDKMNAKFFKKITHPSEKELFPSSPHHTSKALLMPSLEDMNKLLKGLQDVCWGGSASATADNVRAVLSICGEGTVQYLATYAYYLSHINDMLISSAFLLDVLRDKLVTTQTQSGADVWNGFILPLYQHWLTSQKSLNNELAMNCQQHEHYDDQRGGEDLAFGNIFRTLFSVSGTLGTCEGAYDLLMMACTGIVCNSCRISVLEVVQRNRCNEELTSEQRTNLMVLLLSVGVAEGDTDAADAAMRVPLSPKEAAGLVRGLLPAERKTIASGMMQVEKTMKSPTKKEKRGGIGANKRKPTKNSKETPLSYDEFVTPLLRSCDGSWMNALVCLTEHLLEETWSSCDDGNREPLLCALFDAIAAIKGKCYGPRAPEEEGVNQQQFMFSADEEHCLRCCMEALEAVGRDGGWSDGSIVIDQRHVDAIGEILSSCTTPSTRRCGIRLMAIMTEASPVNTMASVMSLVLLLSTSPSDVWIVDSVLLAVLPAIRRAASVIALEGGDKNAAACVCAQDICLSFQDCWPKLAPVSRPRVFRALMDGLGKGSETVVALSLLTSDEALAEPETMKNFVHDLLLRADPKFQILALSNLVTASHRLTYALEMDGDEGLEEKDIEHNKLLLLDVILPPQSGTNEEHENVTTVMPEHFLRASLEIWLSGGLSLPVELMAFVVKHLSSRKLHMQVVGKHSSHDAIQRGFLQLCEDILELLLGLSGQDEDDNVDFKQFEELRNSVNETLDLIQRLLDLPAFLSLTQALLVNKDARVRQRALEMLISRLETSVSFFKEEERSLVLDMLPDLEECLLLNESQQQLRKSGENDVDEDDYDATTTMMTAAVVVKDKQTALLGIQVICRFLGSESGALSKLKKSLSVVSAWLTRNTTSVAVVNEADSSIRLNNLTAALVCLASLTEALGPAALEYWPQFMPIMLRTFESSVGSPLLNSSKRQRSRRQRKTLLHDNTQSSFELTIDNEKEEGSGGVLSLLCNSVIASLYHVTKALPQFLAPYLQRILVAISMPAVLEADATRYFSLLIEQIESRLLLPALYSAHAAVLELPDTRARLLTFVKQATEASPRQFLTEQPGSDMASEFALTALEGHEFDSKGETAGQDVLVSLVLRLTEKELAGLFHQLCEWGHHEETQEVEKKNRHEGPNVAFLGALCALGENLRALAIPFLIKAWPDIMKPLHSSFQPSIDDENGGNSTTLNLGKKRKGRRSVEREDENGPIANCHAADYWCAQVYRALACATLCVQYDQHEESRGGLIGNDRFEDLASAVCDLFGSFSISLSSRGGGLPLAVAIEHCLGTMGTNPPSEEMRRKLMLMVLRRMRDELPCVRVAAVRCCSQIILSAKEEGLLMLPECLPHFQELLEDSDPEVESEVHQLLHKVEEMLGESIESYMQ